PRAGPGGAPGPRGRRRVGPAGRAHLAGDLVGLVRPALRPATPHGRAAARGRPRLAGHRRPRHPPHPPPDGRPRRPPPPRPPTLPPGPPRGGGALSPQGRETPRAGPAPDEGRDRPGRRLSGRQPTSRTRRPAGSRNRRRRAAPARPRRPRARPGTGHTP